MLPTSKQGHATSHLLTTTNLASGMPGMSLNSLLTLTLGISERQEAARRFIPSRAGLKYCSVSITDGGYQSQYPCNQNKPTHFLAGLELSFQIARKMKDSRNEDTYIVMSKGGVYVIRG